MTTDFEFVILLRLKYTYCIIVSNYLDREFVVDYSKPNLEAIRRENYKTGSHPASVLLDKSLVRLCA